jgi:hypothetical protein
MTDASAGPGGRASRAGPRQPLSPDSNFHGALMELLDAALPRLLAWAEPLRPRGLLLLGSARWGEAVAATLPDGRWLPLSDLDLGLFVDVAATSNQHARLRELCMEIGEVSARLRLARNPLDVGLYPLSALHEIPRTIELDEAIRAPHALWGEVHGLEQRCGPFDAHFEALRLILNRVLEVATPPGGGGRYALHAPMDSAWPGTPDAEDWFEAYRRVKLPIDCAKALLARHGIASPTVSGRVGDLERAAREGCVRPPAGGGNAQLRTAVRWRSAPAWPPPRLEVEELAALSRAYLAEIEPAVLAADRRAWAHLLRRERGAPRERLRRWRRMLAHRPPGVSAYRAARFGWRWSRAWPASLIMLGVAAAWVLAATRDPRGQALRALLVREFPVCEDLTDEEWTAAWSAALPRLQHWARTAGG